MYDDTLDGVDGVAQYVKTLGSWLSSRGHKVSYLVGETNMDHWHGGRVYSLARNLKVSFNANHMSTPWPASRHKIKDALAGCEVDVLHVQAPHSPFMAQKVINAADADVAVVGTFHVFPAGRLALYGTKLLRLLYVGGLNKIDKLVSVSRAAQDFARKTFGLDSQVVPNAVDISRFRTGNKDGYVDDKIVFLGRLVDRKGCRLLVEAFALLHKSHPAARLCIAGDGPQRQSLEALVRKMGIEEAVEFLGFIDEAEKPAFLASAHIACFPSLYGESFGIVLIEAMAAGAGVVLGGDNPGYRGVLGEQEYLLVNPTETEAFAKRLELLLDDKKLTSRLHQWQQRTISQYDIDNVGQKMLEIYTQAIDIRRKSGHN